MNPESALEQYENIIPILENLYDLTETVARTAILPLFLLSLFFSYTRDGGLKGAVFARVGNLLLTFALLLIFPSFAAAVRQFGQDFALMINNMQGVDDILNAAKQRAESHLENGSVLGLLGLTLSGIFLTVTYFILYVVRFLLIAFYQFYWGFMYVVGPLLILGALFKTGIGIALNLFKTIFTISAWPVVWALLSAIFEGLPFASAYQIEGNYITVCAMNLVIAIAMMLSPFLLSIHLDSAGSHGSGLGLAVVGHSTFGPFIHSAMITSGIVGRSAASKVRRGARNIRKTVARKRAATRSVFFFLATTAFSFASAAQLNVIPGQATLICLLAKPEKAVLSSAKYFDITQVGSNLLVTSLKSNQTAVLHLFYNDKLSPIDLTSNPLKPHQIDYGCKTVAFEQANMIEATKPVKRLPRKRTRQKQVQRKAKRSIAQEKAILSVDKTRWSNKTRDYLNVVLTIHNRTDAPLLLDWNSLQLRQDKSIFKFSRLAAKRELLPAHAQMPVYVQFTRPSLNNSSRPAIFIQSNRGVLSAPLGRAF